MNGFEFKVTKKGQILQLMLSQDDEDSKNLNGTIRDGLVYELIKRVCFKQCGSQQR